MKKDPDLSRRNFLKSSVVGAGALTAGVAGGLVLPGKAHAAPLSLPIATLDVEEVRKLAWGHYFNSGG